MIKNVTLVSSGDKWTDEGVFTATVRLKQDELFKGFAKRDGEGVEVRINTGIPSEDYNVSITLHDDGQVLIGRLVHGHFELS